MANDRWALVLCLLAGWPVSFRPNLFHCLPSSSSVPCCPRFSSFQAARKPREERPRLENPGRRGSTREEQMPARWLQIGLTLEYSCVIGQYRFSFNFWIGAATGSFVKIIDYSEILLLGVKLQADVLVEIEERIFLWLSPLEYFSSTTISTCLVFAHVILVEVTAIPPLPRDGIGVHTNSINKRQSCQRLR
ncbi:hypothetical protein VPH35_019958 [Triticum aestivum]